MKNIHIKNHLWMNGGSVGIDASIKEDVEITIGTKKKDGTLLYPKGYFYPKGDLLNAPIMKFKKGIPVRVVKIKDMYEDF